MEDWIVALKKRILSVEPNLPDDDWKRLESYYLASRRRRRFYPLLLSVVSAAAVLILFFLRVSSSRILVPESKSLPTAFPLIPIYETDKVVDLPNLVIDEHKDFDPSITAHLSEPIENKPTNKTFEERDSSHVINLFSHDTAPVKKGIDNNIICSENHAVTHYESWKRHSFASVFKGLTGGTLNQSSIAEPSRLYSLYGIDFTDGSMDGSLTSHHLVPITVGIDFSFSILSPRFALSTGLGLSLYLSTFNGKDDGDFIEHSQKALYAEIPVRMDWRIWSHDKVSAWMGVGGKADYLVFGKMDSIRLKDNRIHWSIIGDLSLQYQISPQLGIFLQPELSYYFKPSNPVVLTYRTEHPLVFSVGVGLRFTL